MKSPQEKQRCLQCFLSGRECHSGTLSGSCINCGKTRFGNGSLSNDGFFSRPIFQFIFKRMRVSKHMHLGYDQSCRDSIEITSGNPHGPRIRYKVDWRCEYNPLNPKIIKQIDNIVWRHYTPDIRAKHETTNLIRDAICASGYLSFLFASTVVEQNPCQNPAEFDEANALKADLSLHLTIFILFRLDGLISEILRAPEQNIPRGMEDYWLDVSAATALLYVKLMDVHAELRQGRLKPLCGGVPLANLLRDQIQATAQQLMLALQGRGLNCNRKWATHLDGNLDGIRGSIKLEVMTLSIQRTVQFLEATRSTSSSLSTAFTNEGPSEFLHNQFVPINSKDNVFMSINNHDWPNMDSKLPYISEMDYNFPLLAGFGDQASTAYTGQSNGSCSPTPSLATLVSEASGISYDTQEGMEQMQNHVSGAPSYLYDAADDTSVLLWRPISF